MFQVVLAFFFSLLIKGQSLVYVFNPFLGERSSVGASSI